MLLDAERTIVVFVLAHNWIVKYQETNGAVKSLTDNNLEAIVFIPKLVFVFTACHYFVALFTKGSIQNLQGQKQHNYNDLHFTLSIIRSFKQQTKLCNLTFVLRDATIETLYEFA